jgi:hypothetical protein
MTYSVLGRRHDVPPSSGSLLPSHAATTLSTVDFFTNGTYYCMSTSGSDVEMSERSPVVSIVQFGARGANHRAPDA